MVNELLLLSGNDIPFIEAQITIHQPTVKEIALIGEENFYIGCEMLTFSKDILNEEDRNNLRNQNDFEVLMALILDNRSDMRKNKIASLMVLSLLFPDYEINFSFKEISLKKEDETRKINNQNFERFKEILTEMFCLKGNSGNKEIPDTYNPGGELARKIAEKLKKGRQAAAAAKGEQKVSILTRYVSILSVGLQQDMNSFLNYTVYQLFDEFKRYELKEAFDYYFQAKLAGARDLKEVDNWKKDIHP